MSSPRTIVHVDSVLTRSLPMNACSSDRSRPVLNREGSAAHPGIASRALAKAEPVPTALVVSVRIVMLQVCGDCLDRCLVILFFICFFSVSFTFISRGGRGALVFAGALKDVLVSPGFHCLVVGLSNRDDLLCLGCFFGVPWNQSQTGRDLP